nr:uncharacterized protein LOC120367564 [Saimiri boliviensis boliviensis]
MSGLCLSFAVYPHGHAKCLTNHGCSANRRVCTIVLTETWSDLRCLMYLLEKVKSKIQALKGDTSCCGKGEKKRAKVCRCLPSGIKMTDLCHTNGWSVVPMVLSIPGQLSLGPGERRVYFRHISAAKLSFKSICCFALLGLWSPAEIHYLPFQLLRLELRFPKGKMHFGGGRARNPRCLLLVPSNSLVLNRGIKLIDRQICFMILVFQEKKKKKKKKKVLYRLSFFSQQVLIDLFEF